MSCCFGCAFLPFAVGMPVDFLLTRSVDWTVLPFMIVIIGIVVGSVVAYFHQPEARIQCGTLTFGGPSSDEQAPPGLSFLASARAVGHAVPLEQISAVGLYNIAKFYLAGSMRTGFYPSHSYLWQLVVWTEDNARWTVVHEVTSMHIYTRGIARSKAAEVAHRLADEATAARMAKGLGQVNAILPAGGPDHNAAWFPAATGYTIGDIDRGEATGLTGKEYPGIYQLPQPFTALFLQAAGIGLAVVVAFGIVTIVRAALASPP